jgi:hypothetical protein
MLKCQHIAHATALLVLIFPCWTAASSRRVDLVEFGRVVELPDDPRRPTTAADELSRGQNGWEALRGRDGLFTIGVEWDEPRELAEVNIEFRHAIAQRDQIQVQYWEDLSDGEAEDTADRSVKGRWMRPKTEWWAGDRDVSFSFLPEDHETAGRGEPGKLTRRTTRLRFICGKEDLPPVRYLRAYGPEPAATDTFDIRFDGSAALVPPVAVRIVNGFILASDGRTNMTSAVLREDASSSLHIRYIRTGAESLNRTKLTLGPVENHESQTAIYPADVARLGELRVAQAGVVIERRGGKVAEARGAVTTAPAAR